MHFAPSPPVPCLWDALVAGCNDAKPRLVAQRQQVPHGGLGVHAILLAQGVHHILHQHKARLEVVHDAVEGLQLAVPAWREQMEGTNGRNLSLCYSLYLCFKVSCPLCL